MREYRFTIPGPPVPKQRARVSPAGHAYYAKRPAGSNRLDYPEYKEWVQGCFMAEYGSRQRDHKPDQQGYHLEVHAFVRSARGDFDNLAGSIGDALEGLVWENDRQIASSVFERHLAADTESVRVEVSIRSVGERPFIPSDWDEIVRVLND